MAGTPIDCTVVILKPSAAFAVPVLVELEEVVELVDDVELVVELDEDDELAAHVGGAPMQSATASITTSIRNISDLCSCVTSGRRENHPSLA